MRTEEEVARLAHNISEAVTGGVQVHADLQSLRRATVMLLVLQWVLGGENSICELAQSLEDVPGPHLNEPKGVM